MDRLQARDSFGLGSWFESRWGRNAVGTTSGPGTTSSAEQLGETGRAFDLPDLALAVGRPRRREHEAIREQGLEHLAEIALLGERAP